MDPSRVAPRATKHNTSKAGSGDYIVNEDDWGAMGGFRMPCRTTTSCLRDLRLARVRGSRGTRSAAYKAAQVAEDSLKDPAGEALLKAANATFVKGPDPQG